MEVTVEQNKMELDYPKLMISDNGQIIIALSENEANLVGFMIKSNGYPFCDGSYSENIYKPAFKDFHGTITIEQ